MGASARLPPGDAAGVPTLVCNGCLTADVGARNGLLLTPDNLLGFAAPRADTAPSLGLITDADNAGDVGANVEMMGAGDGNVVTFTGGVAGGSDGILGVAAPVARATGAAVGVGIALAMGAVTAGAFKI